MPPQRATSRQALWATCTPQAGRHIKQIEVLPPITLGDKRHPSAIRRPGRPVIVGGVRCQATDDHSVTRCQHQVAVFGAVLRENESATIRPRRRVPYPRAACQNQTRHSGRFGVGEIVSPAQVTLPHVRTNNRKNIRYIEVLPFFIFYDECHTLLMTYYLAKINLGF